MAYKVLEGKYRAKVTKISFGAVGDNNSPVIEVEYKPVGPYVGDAVQNEEGLPTQNFTYWLGLEVVEKGKYAGKSKLEAIRMDFEETYGYNGAFDPEAMSAAIVGKEVDLVCIKTQKGEREYTKVKYVNAIGGKKGGKKPIKHLTADAIAAFGAKWNTAPAQAPKDATSLFAQLTGGKQ